MVRYYGGRRGRVVFDDNDIEDEEESSNSGMESYLMVRVLWVKRKDAEDAYENYIRAVLDCESEAIENGILPDSETLIVMKWNKDAESLYNFIKQIGKYIDERKKRKK